jgi:hypothetical protein
MNLLVAICGDQINSYRSKIEALLADPQHERQVCEDPARRRMEGTTHEQVVPLLCWEVGEAPAPVGRKRNCQRLTHRTCKAVEAVSKTTAPAIFACAGTVFRQFEITKNSEPSIAPQAAARPVQLKLRAADYRYCGS